MSFFLTGNVPINSTFAPVTDPSTAALLAELDSTNFQLSPQSPKERIYSVMAYLGGSTGAYWVVEHVTSTSVGAAAVVDRAFVRTASGQTSQFVFKFRLTALTDRIRVRHPSSVTGTFDAKLSAEELG
jgi:hypothetical protein